MKRNVSIHRLVTLGAICSIILFSMGRAFASDHNYHAWGQFLKEHVRSGLVDYSVVKKTPGDFERAVHEMESVASKEYESWTAKGKMAFWINAYNVGAIRLILDHYPIKKSFGLSALRYPSNSIQQIPDVWNSPVLNLLGKKVSLNYIENEMLRKEFEDPRSHFSIVCASMGCPVLREEAYNPERLDAQLNDQVMRFVNTPSKFRYEAGNDKLFLSPIFKWFMGDFEKKGGIIPFLKNYASQDAALKLSNTTRIEWQYYDWRLNDQK